MNQYQIAIMTLNELKAALRLKKLNQELYEQLIGSIRWLLRYSEKNGIALPDRDKLSTIVERTHTIIGKFATPSDDGYQPDESDGKLTEPHLNRIE